MSKELKIGERIVILRISDGNLERGKVIDTFPEENRVRVGVSSVANAYWSRNFDTITGLSLDDEGKWKMLDEYDIAVKEVGMKCPHCGVSQRNFFMACEFLQGGKNCNCFYCKKLLWLYLDGNTKKVTGD